MNERFFKFAREASFKSDYHGSGSSPRLGSIAVYKGTIIAEAWNSDKTSPLQSHYNIYRYNNDSSLPAKSHCETQIIQKIRWKFGNNLKWDKIDIYLYRELKDGTLANSRPCKSCMKMLRDFGLRRIFYSTENGYCEERFK